MDQDAPIIEFAFPGPLRDALLAAIVSGAKTSTSSLLREYEVSAEPLPIPGQRGIVVDSAGLPVMVVETTAVDVVRLGDVPLSHAIDEGEGYESVADWRAGHESFWNTAEMRAELGADVALDDDSLIVLERFAIVRSPDDDR